MKSYFVLPALAVLAIGMSLFSWQTAERFALIQLRVLKTGEESLGLWVISNRIASIVGFILAAIFLAYAFLLFR